MRITPAAQKNRGPVETSHQTTTAGLLSSVRRIQEHKRVTSPTFCIHGLEQQEAIINETIVEVNNNKSIQNEENDSANCDNTGNWQLNIEQKRQCN
jgi:hypothetical protein